MSAAKAASKYRVSPARVRRLLQRRRQTGEAAPRARRHGPVPLPVTHGEQIRQAAKGRPDATLAEPHQKLGLAVALRTPRAAVAAPGLTLKKKWPGRPSRAGPT
jgi:transposase